MQVRKRMPLLNSGCKNRSEAELDGSQNSIFIQFGGGFSFLYVTIFVCYYVLNIRKIFSFIRTKYFLKPLRNFIF